ncbi:hypothetical protein DZC31_22090 [Stenotrophomonas rhizophila]|nr:hypothetical protein DZC31_22090 [Stenotrophomonas rhizophila]
MHEGLSSVSSHTPRPIIGLQSYTKAYHRSPVIHQGGSCWRHRRDWPETNVGAGLSAMRRAGGARSHRHCNLIVEHPRRK